MPILCPLCARDDDTQTHTRDDGITYAVCLDRSDGLDGFAWEPTPPPGRSFRSYGLGADLEIWDRLLELVEPGEFQPFGVVEDRFVTRFPNETKILAERFGHRWRFPEYPSTQYSMSAYLASRLRELKREGHLDLAWAKAEDQWSHNGIISQWRKRSGRPLVGDLVGLRSARRGDYRIVYEIFDEEKVVDPQNSAQKRRISFALIGVGGVRSRGSSPL